ncbi:MAG: long-chain-fatty-acid--CoA ligase [Candidatus Thorarchaeota archaeon]
MEDMLWHQHKWPEGVKKTLEYPEEPLYAMLDSAAEKSGDLPYTAYGGLSWTFAEVRDSADRIANFLASKGITKGDRVAIFLPNVPAFPPIFFGALKAGATVVTCNPQYKAAELNFQLSDSGAKIVFVFDHETFVPTCYEAIKGTDVTDVIVCSIKSFLPKIKAILGGLLGKIPKSPFYEEGITTFYDAIIEEYEPNAPTIEYAPEDIGLILYTGGTTGVPKGAALKQSNLYANCLQIMEYVVMSPEDTYDPGRIKYGKEVFVGALPFYHSYGLTLTMLLATHQASKLVCIPDPRAGKPPMSDLLSELQNEGGTILNCVPALYSAIINHPNIANYDLSKVKVCSSGAAPLPPELAKKFEAVTGGVLFEGYGLSETSPVTHISPTTKKDRKFGSIGLPIPDTICKILDIETGNKELAQGETGEIAVSGPQVMIGYWKREAETEEVMRTIDGKRFFLTGDIGHMDEEGFTVISDRKKNMINVGGLKAYPREIEDVFFEHPKVAMAAIVGIPRDDDPSNEFVKAYIVLKPGVEATEEEFIEWAKEKMAGYKRPKEVKFMDTLPLTAVGKVLHRELKKMEMETRGK